MDKNDSIEGIAPDQSIDQCQAGAEAIRGVIDRSLKRSRSPELWDDWLDSDDHEESDDDDDD